MNIRYRKREKKYLDIYIYNDFMEQYFGSIYDAFYRFGIDFEALPVSVLEKASEPAGDWTIINVSRIPYKEHYCFNKKLVGLS